MRPILISSAIALTTLLACDRTEPAPVPPEEAAAPSEAESAGPRFYEGMGTYSRPVTTSNADAQRYFDEGMAFLHGFNHDEAIRSFDRAAALDPDCAMAHAAKAMALGPHINNPEVPPEAEKAAVEAIARARAASGASEVERGLIEALAARYADPAPEDRGPLDQAYATAMKELWARYPDDADVGAWTAEALMDLHPWDLWTATGKPKEGTREIVALLEKVIALRNDHPLALHLYIHAVEASPDPGRADEAANRLRDLVPAHGHLRHMPSHIDVRRGRWAEAIAANQRAVEADIAYRKASPEQHFYALYMAHNRHMLAFAAMMIGHSEQALSAMNALVEAIPPEFAEANPAIADGYFVMPVEVMMRFGKWDDILAVPEFGEKFPLSRTLRHYGRGVAYSATDRVKEARAELEAMREAAKGIAPDAMFGVNPASSLTKIADRVLEGEILYREGEGKKAVKALREAVALEDALTYDEPPDWVQPVRHALGAVLLAQKKAKDAEKVYRKDLEAHPENGWALWGLARSLRLQGKDDEAAKVDERFAAVWKDADIELHSSCMCLPGV